MLLSFSLSVAGCGGTAYAEKEALSGQSYGECVKTLLQPSFAIMDRMKAQGLDLERPRLVTHLLVGSDDKIREAANFAEQKGFKVTERANGRLLIEEDAPIIEDWLKHTIPVFCSLAAEYKLTYDGWDVDVSKDGLKRK